MQQMHYCIRFGANSEPKCAMELQLSIIWQVRIMRSNPAKPIKINYYFEKQIQQHSFFLPLPIEATCQARIM